MLDRLRNYWWKGVDENVIQVIQACHALEQEQDSKYPAKSCIPLFYKALCFDGVLTSED